MTVTNTTSIVSYSGDDLTVNFPTTFPFFDSSDLIVLQRVIATGVETTLVEGGSSDYTVTGGGGGTGTVVANTAPSSLVTWTIKRETTRRQETDLVNNAALPSDSLEAELDRGALRVIELDRDSNRTLRLADTDPTAIDPLPVNTERQGQYLGFTNDAAANPVALAAPANTTAVSAFGATLIVLPTAAAARGVLEVVKLQIGDIGLRPAAPVYGVGLFYARDEPTWYYSDSITWEKFYDVDVIESFTQATLPAAATAGRFVYDTDNEILYRDNGTSLEPVNKGLGTGYIGGLEAQRFNADDMEFNPGKCRDFADTQDLILDIAMVKELDTAGGWVAGSTNAGRPTGVALASSTWYHCFIIGKPDGTVDAGFDTSLTAANLLGGGAGQAGAAGFTTYRRVGSRRTNSSSEWSNFTQHGDDVIWTGQTLDSNEASIDDSGADVLIPLSYAPAGIRTEVTLSVNTNVVRVVTHGDATIGSDPSDTAAPMSNVPNNATSSFVKCWTNASAFIKTRANATGTRYIQVTAFRDTRGKDGGA